MFLISDGRESQSQQLKQKRVLCSIITQITFLLPFIYYEQQNYSISFCLWKLRVYVVMVLSAAPVRGQTLSPEDITDKECQVSGVVQPKPSDKWKYTDSTYLAIKYIFPWKIGIGTMQPENMFFRFMRSANMPKKLRKSILIMMGVEGGTVLPLLSGSVKVIFMYWIKVKIGLDS